MGIVNLLIVIRGYYKLLIDREWKYCPSIFIATCIKIKKQYSSIYDKE